MANVLKSDIIEKIKADEELQLKISKLPHKKVAIRTVQRWLRENDSALVHFDVLTLIANEFIIPIYDLIEESTSTATA